MRLLAGHGDAEAFVGVDVVVVVVGAEVDLDPVDLAGESAGFGGVVGADGCAGFVADVGGFVAGEDHWLGGGDAAGADGVAVVVEGDVAAFGEAAAVVGELHADLVGAGGDRFGGFGGELLDPEHVVHELGV